MSKQILTFLTVVIIASCRRSTPLALTENERVVIVDSIQHTLKNYHSDISRSGLTAEFKYLDSSSEFFWVPPGYSSAIFYDSIVSILKQNANSYKSIDNSFSTLRINPLSKEFATYNAIINSTMTDNNNIVSNYSLIETGVLIRRPDGWKLLNGQTAVLPLAK